MGWYILHKDSVCIDLSRVPFLESPSHVTPTLVQLSRERTCHPDCLALLSLTILEMCFGSIFQNVKNLVKPKFNLHFCTGKVMINFCHDQEMKIKQARKSSEDAQAAGFAQFEKVWAG